MPAASTSHGRRSGAVNSSRGRRSAGEPSSESRIGEAGSSSTDQPLRRARLGLVEEEEGDAEEEEEEEDSGAAVSNNVRQVLHQFEQQTHPLTSDVADATIRASMNQWTPMDTSLDAAVTLVSDVAERRADALDQLHDGEQDARLNKLDSLFLQFLDLKKEASFRRQALTELRQKIESGEEVTDATELYTGKVHDYRSAYLSKTKRQRYGASKQYEKFKSKIWDAMHDDNDPMPPLTDLIDAESGEEDEETDEVAIFGGATQNYKCPITLMVMVNPMKSTVCRHSYERDAIFEYLGSATKPCPAGCQSKLNKRQLVEDAELTKACRMYARRKERRRERDRTQAEATMLD